MVKTVAKTKIKAKLKKSSIKSIKKTKAEVGGFCDPYNVCDVIDTEEKKSNVVSMSVGNAISPSVCLSTGLVSLDHRLGGGIAPGHWYEFVGKEQGGKTTLVNSTCHEALLTIPRYTVGMFLDVEGTLDYVWFSHIVKVKNLEAVFGLRDQKTGEWVIKPRIRYYKPSFGEDGLKLVKKILKGMPDKTLIDETWYYVWVPTQNKNADVDAKTQALKSKLNGKYNKKLFSKTGNFYVPVPDNYGGIEFMVWVDSFAAMDPEVMAEDQKASMAPQASMFSKHVKTIRTMLSKKKATLIGTNQVREKPGVNYGDPTYQPGGNALAHACDCRIRVTPISSPKGPVEFEGESNEYEYRYTKLKTVKNKLAVPHQEVTLRWWTGWKGKSGFGPDPVKDLFNFFETIGYIIHVGRKFSINLPDIKNKKFSWNSFRNFILKEDGEKILRTEAINILHSGKNDDVYKIDTDKSDTDDSQNDDDSDD